MGTGRPLKPRLEIPDAVDIAGYSGQLNNIWEF